MTEQQSRGQSFQVLLSAVVRDGGMSDSEVGGGDGTNKAVETTPAWSPMRSVQEERASSGCGHPLCILVGGNELGVFSLQTDSAASIGL